MTCPSSGHENFPSKVIEALKFVIQAKAITLRAIVLDDSNY